MAPTLAAVPMIKDGRLRALAVSGRNPDPAVPDLPTIAAKLPGFSATSWFAILAPAGTPAAVIKRLNAELDRIVHEPETRKRFAAIGGEPIGGPPSTLASLIRDEIPALAAGRKGSRHSHRIDPPVKLNDVKYEGVVEMADFAGSHVVVTGGTGALGRAVIGALRAANAVCHVPNLDCRRARRLSLRGRPRSAGSRAMLISPMKRRSGAFTVIAAALGVHSPRRRLCDGADRRNLGGRFPRTVPDECAVVLFVLGGRCRRVSCAPGSRARAGVGGRIVNVSARPALEPRLGVRNGGVHRVQIGGRGADPVTGAGIDRRADLGERGRPFHPRYAGKPRSDAGCRPPPLGRTRRSGGSHRVSRLAGQPCDPRRRHPGLRRVISRARKTSVIPAGRHQEFDDRWTGSVRLFETAVGQDGGRLAQDAAPRTAQGRLAIHPGDDRL